MPLQVVSVYLSVCLFVDLVWAVATVPLQIILSVSLNTPNMPEYTPLELPTSRLYKPDFFLLLFGACERAKPLYNTANATTS